MREMKDSGVAWLGDIDSRFDIKAIGNLFTIKKDIIGREPDQVLSITQRGIKIKDTTSNEGQNAASYAHYQIVNVGDFAMNHMDLLTGWVDISRYEGVTSPDYRVFTLTDNTQIPEYFLRVFQMYYSNRVFYAFGQGAANLGRWRLPRENFVKIAIPFPPVELQRKIVDEIATKVSKVDALIANQQAQIEKLKQYKQSLITEVVTKGLEPNAPMKNSGVEWIGVINSRYSLQRIKHFICEYKAGPFGSALITGNLLSEGSILVYTPEHIANQSTDNSKNLFLPESRRSEMEQFFVSQGNIIFPIVGSLGRAMYITADMPEGIINQRLAKFRIDESRVDKDYFLYLFAKSDFYKPFLDVNSRGAIIVNLTKEIVYNMPFIIPPVDEQREIVSYLDEKCAYIDRLITLKTQKTEKLTQYKRSLIYEYVTGKKEAGLHE